MSTLYLLPRLLPHLHLHLRLALRLALRPLLPPLLPSVLYLMPHSICACPVSLTSLLSYHWLGKFAVVVRRLTP
jgi:hypothetical protein